MEASSISSNGPTGGWCSLLPRAIGDPGVDENRRAGILIAVAFLGVAIGLLSAVVHLATGQLMRAGFTAGVGIPILSSLLVLRWTGRVDWSAHYLCTLFTLCVLASPFFSAEGVPVYVGLIGVPVVSAAIAGSRAGAFWTLVTVSLLVASSLLASLASAFTPPLSVLSWNTAIVTGVCGVTAAWTERSRERATVESRRAQERADHDARSRADAEEALRSSQALFATAFREAPSLLMVVALDDGKIVDVNESFERISGWSRREACGQEFRSLCLADEADRVRLCRLVGAASSIRDEELSLRTKDETSRSILTSVERVELVGRACLLVQGVDITDRKRGEEELARSRNELEERVAERGEQLRISLERLKEQERLVAVGTLAAGIAHQINNPIGAISAAAEFALLVGEGREDEDGSAIRERALVTALEEAHRCGRIVKGVLQFARDDPKAKWIGDLNPVVRRACEQVRGYVTERKGMLVVDTAAQRLLVRMSPIDLEQVIVNLVRNAVESRDRGVRVEVRTQQVGSEVRLEVSDDGPGIADSIRGHVFEPFYTTRLEEGGSGLGLSVVHGVIGDHGGEVDLGKSPAGGTCFRIRLPLEKAPELLDAFSEGNPESTRL